MKNKIRNTFVVRRQLHHICYLFKEKMTDAIIMKNSRPRCPIYRTLIPSGEKKVRHFILYSMHST